MAHGTFPKRVVKQVGAHKNNGHGHAGCWSRNESAQKQTNVSIENTESEGLRRRRGNTATSTHGNTDNEATYETNKWTTENELQPTTIQNEEERLRYADPLNLFGVPPPALRVAQTKSRSAIAYYVEVANLAREIMKITNNEQSK